MPDVLDGNDPASPLTPRLVLTAGNTLGLLYSLTQSLFMFLQSVFQIPNLSIISCVLYLYETCGPFNVNKESLCWELLGISYLKLKMTEKYL